MADRAHIVLVETASNQAFVFQTNKLREIVGASGLIHEAGTHWAAACLSQAEGADRDNPSDPAEGAVGTVEGRARRLRAAPLIETGAVVEPVVLTSGKAVFLVDSRARGEALVCALTLRALKEAPGLTVRGAVSDEAIDLGADTAKNTGGAMRNLFRSVEALRLALPPAEARFALLPPVEPCRTSGLPSEGTERGEPLSAPSLAKRRAVWAAMTRVRADLPGLPLADNPDDLVEAMRLPWLGVVHADGNGFGQVFMNLAAYCKGKDGKDPTARDYLNLYRNLSVALDLVGVTALRSAAPVLGTRALKGQKDGAVPLLVNVMGGDDLTVICDGSRAVAFARAYLDAFEEAVRQETFDLGDGRTMTNPICRLTDVSGTPMRFGAAAGIAIVKPHHPLHRAYELAEELTRSAKALVKRRFSDPGLSALDFQIVFGDSTSDLGDLRAGWQIASLGAVARAHARPYVTTAPSRVAEDKRPLAETRHFARLEQARAQLHRQDGGRKALPRAQQHELRDALFGGKAVADARLQLIAARYGEAGSGGGGGIDWTRFGGSATTLYFDDHSDAKGMEDETPLFRTRLLDAMDLIDVGQHDAADAP